MYIRWSDPAYGQHYLGGRHLDHAVIVGAYDWSSSQRIVRMVNDHDDRSASLVPEDNEVDNIVDLAKIHGCAEVVHTIRRSMWTPSLAFPETPDSRAPSIVSVLAYDGNGSPTLHTILCTWGCFMNDAGDTIDQWNVYMNPTNKRMWEHLRTSEREASTSIRRATPTT